MTYGNTQRRVTGITARKTVTIAIGRTRMTTKCFLCQRDGNDTEQFCHKHHVFEGKNRQASERAGFYVFLCPDHHTLIHRDHAVNLELKKETQREYEKTHTRADFMRIIGRNYLDE